MQVKKIQTASHASGRGIDNTYTPAKYGVYDTNDNFCGYLNASSVRQFDCAIWILSDVNHKVVKRFYKGFRNAKQIIGEMHHDLFTQISRCQIASSDQTID